jgi:hypothetical protein
MKKVLFLLLVTSISYGQALFDKGVKITGGITTDNTATKVVVQSANNVLNTISKSDLQDAFYFASASAFPVTGITDKLYIARDNNILYRFNGTIYAPLSADISGKEDTVNKSSSFTASSTTTYANTKALVDGLATKQNTISGTPNVIPKFGSGGLVGSNIFDDGANLGINNTTPSRGVHIKSNTGTGGLLIEHSTAFSGNILEARSNLNGAYFAVDFGGGITGTGGINITGESNFQKVGVSNTPIFAYMEGNGLNGLKLYGAAGIDLHTISNADAIHIKQSGNTLFNTATDNNQGTVQVNGAITASPATLSNQVVVKSQLDLKADLASPNLTGTPTAPTATAGTNTTQIATTAFVLANATNIPQLESNSTDLTVWNNGKGNVATNTSFGDGALRSNTSGGQNIAIGNNSLSLSTTAISNAGIGFNSLLKNTTGSNNVSIGAGSLSENTTGSNNVAIGSIAGANSNFTSSQNSVFLGRNTQPLNNSETNQIVIGFDAIGAGSNTATLGNTSITSTILRGTVSASNATALNHLVTKAQTLYTNQTVTANKTVAIAEFVNNNHLILRVDTTAGNVTITLPTFTALAGYKVTVRKIDSSANSISITGVGGVNIDGASTLVVSGQYGKSTVGADLVQYIIL